MSTDPFPACDRSPCRTRHRDGFSLLELLVVIAVLATLVGLTLPSVQKAREAGRRMTCLNNVRQCGLAVLSYESKRRRFPMGFDQAPSNALPGGTLHAWSSFVLPFLGEAPTTTRIDYRREWNAPGENAAAGRQRIATYRCPSAILDYDGKADYGGIAGAWILGLPGGDPPATRMTDGLLIPVTAPQECVRAAAVTDGLSHTLMIGEAIDRGPAPGDPATDDDPFGRWAVYNSFPLTEPAINATKSDIQSLHPGGAVVAFGDARVVFLQDSTDPLVLSAIGSRSGGETAQLP